MDKTASRVPVAFLVLCDADRELTVGRIVGVPVDLDLIEVLARLRLRAQRVGCTVHVRDADPALESLLHLTGLSDLFECPRAPSPTFGQPTPDH